MIQNSENFMPEMGMRFAKQRIQTYQRNGQGKEMMTSVYLKHNPFEKTIQNVTLKFRGMPQL